MKIIIESEIYFSCCFNVKLFQKRRGKLNRFIHIMPNCARHFIGHLFSVFMISLESEEYKIGGKERDKGRGKRKSENQNYYPYTNINLVYLIIVA